MEVAMPRKLTDGAGQEQGSRLNDSNAETRKETNTGGRAYLALRLVYHGYFALYIARSRKISQKDAVIFFNLGSG
jgi:hypothetical protein